MPSKAEIEQVRRALSSLSDRARQDFLKIWPSLDHDDWPKLRKALESFWPDLVGHYGEMAAVLGSDQFVLQAQQIGLHGDPQMAAGVNAEQANARMRWAIGAPDQQGSLLLILDELVKQPYRETLQGSAGASGGAWARVPSGAKTCEFCLMLASRGAMYTSRAAAASITGENLGGRDYRALAKGASRADLVAGRRGRTAKRPIGAKYHGDCDCQPVLVRSNADLPYDREDLLTRYEKARAEAGTGATKDILSAARTIYPGTH